MVSCLIIVIIICSLPLASLSKVIATQTCQKLDGVMLRQVGDDWDTRKRRARVGEDDDSELSEEEDRLAGLIHMDADDNEDTELTEQARQELRHASALRNANVSPDEACYPLPVFSTRICSGSNLCSLSNHK